MASRGHQNSFVFSPYMTPLHAMHATALLPVGEEFNLIQFLHPSVTMYKSCRDLTSVLPAHLAFCLIAYFFLCETAADLASSEQKMQPCSGTKFFIGCTCQQASDSGSAGDDKKS